MGFPGQEHWSGLLFPLLLYTYAMENYAAIKNNEIMPFTAIWMDLEIIMLSEVRERQIVYDITFM